MKVFDFRCKTKDGDFKFENLSFIEVTETTFDFVDFYGDDVVYTVTEREVDDDVE